MLSYETLDAIADGVNPTLGVLALLFPWLRQCGARRALQLDGLTLLAVALAYGVQAIDSTLTLWPSVGLDYSTHTAVFLCIASSIWQHGRNYRIGITLIGLAYAALMLNQRYHSVLDITSTAFVMLILLVPLWWYARPRSRASETLS